MFGLLAFAAIAVSPVQCTTKEPCVSSIANPVPCDLFRVCTSRPDYVVRITVPTTWDCDNKECRPEPSPTVWSGQGFAVPAGMTMEARISPK